MIPISGAVRDLGKTKMPAMARLVGFRALLCATIAVVWALTGRPSPAETLRLVTDLYPLDNLGNDKAPGFSVEVLRQVFAAMGQDAFFEGLPSNRLWRMVLRGERDGAFAMLRTSERERICLFPDEPLSRARWFLFVRTADVGTLKFSSLDDLAGHDVAVHEAVPGVFEQPTVSAEMWKFLREHHNMVETNSTTESLRMLAAGRVDYAVATRSLGMSAIAKMGLSGKIQPLLSRSVIDEDVYVCFSKARVSPSLVDAFSRALKQFKQTETFQGIWQKYYP
jgi:polar amino acid transport system substrate-binding protein